MTTSRHRDPFAARTVAIVVFAAASLCGGCLEDADVDAYVESAATATGPECRGRLGVMVVVNASGHDLLRIRLVDLEARADLELPLKQRRANVTRYEVLRQDCGPMPSHRRRLLIDLASGQRYEGEISLDSSSSWVVVTPSGIL